MSLKEKVAIVTGGSRGIGYAVANLLSKEGANVVITGRDIRTLREASKKIENCIAIPLVGLQ